ncbi:uncharacterized protein STEHIDRAFT_82793 [Stereum hirsutum FP-91666 SS1]|uniref:uncharacterized protein n=1 Tax=Stereum hirsutum (strain FP-91666) TaxID=721885 RepID=UPI000444980E|nr:uncharacterized protein STEHIDRAFT_82793 [Stereum hirsutum FP-91666 SS1]EIM83892.1 hypothetical protein STEHIDRAFT_82793 [Stereum hirsutum FP-91666 SS1]
MFYNNERVVPFWTQEITKVIRYLGTDNVYISIVESNSDDSTPSLLRAFDSQLSTMNVSRRILTNDTSIARPKSMSTSLPRIEFLSAVRNRVMEPLINQPDFDRVVFSNDVFVTAEGVVELLNTRDGNYDMACGTDLAYWGLHDAWVTRDRLGHLVSSQWPYLLEDTGMNAIMKDEPAPVFTCWNGIVSFRPDPFLPPSSRKSGALSTVPANFEVPESHPWVQEGRVKKGMAPVEMPELRFRASGRRECFGSESFNLPYDLRRVYDMQEIYMNPRVITSYEWSYFVWYKYITRHWLVKWWIEKVEMGDGMHRAKMIVGEADRVWTWDGGECQPGLDWS